MIFKNVELEYDFDVLLSRFREMAFLNKGIVIRLIEQSNLCKVAGNCGKLVN